MPSSQTAPPQEVSTTKTPAKASASRASAKASALACPKCGSTDVRRSQRRDWREKVSLWFQGMLPYRCRECDLRFYGRRPK